VPAIDARRRSRSISYVAFKILFAAPEAAAGTGRHINADATLRIVGLSRFAAVVCGESLASPDLSAFPRSSDRENMEQLQMAARSNSQGSLQ
jgi:hypothetical protein